MRTFLSLLLAPCLLIAAPVGAQVPATIGHQGVLLLPGGRLPLDQALDLSFTIYDAASGGTLLYSRSIPEVPVRRGVYSVLLEDGAQTLAEAFEGAGPRFLEVTIVSAPLEPDLDMTTLRPRQLVAGAPYALRAGEAESLVGETGAVPEGALVLWDQATGCDGEARTCPCGYQEAGEFGGRTIRAADWLDFIPALPDDPGVSLGQVGGTGEFGDALGVGQTPAHQHTLAAVGQHDHPLAADSGYVAHDVGSNRYIETDDDHRQDGSIYDDGTTTDAGGHNHVFLDSGGGPHYHPFRTVLFCRRK